MAKKPPSFVVPEPPPGFRIERMLPSGRHPILEVFPGMDLLATAEHLQPEAEKRAELLQSTEIELVEEDVWMYVAPWEIPPTARGRWNPVVAPGADCIVVGMGHLRESPAFTLFMDIFHELRHVQQRQGGAKLFEGRVSYVRRPTEVEAYRFVVDEARRLGVTDGFLRDYLRVEWIDDGEFLELLTAVGVPPG
ncbi:MAG: hypothetical protein L3K14_09535 [Thermoplasmata archaeon]|nr:hypothetical protein [Thermoplasmata archaeon]